MPRYKTADRDRIDVNAAWSESVRYTKRGGEKRRVIVSVEADIVGADFSERNVRVAAAEVCKALAQAYVNDVRAVAAPASLATRERRQSAHRNQSSRWVKRSYGGGRIGFLEPDPHSIRLFNDSGRLQRVVVNPRRSSQGLSVFTMNFPANRLNPEFFAAGRLEWVIEQLRTYVPALRGQYEGDNADMIRRAERRALKQITMVIGAKQRASLLKRLAEIAKAAGEVAKGIQAFGGR
jgi:hypothetical protein